MSKIQIASEMMLAKNGNDYTHFEEIESIMIEFAKLHVKAALEAASKVKPIEDIYRGRFMGCYPDTLDILSAYPLENIK